MDTNLIGEKLNAVVGALTDLADAVAKVALELEQKCCESWPEGFIESLKIFDQFKNIGNDPTSILEMPGPAISCSGNGPDAILEKPAQEPEEILCDFSTLRQKLAKISQAGHGADVRSLLKKYGAAKLSDVKPEDYNGIWLDADAILKVDVDPLKEAD